MSVLTVVSVAKLFADVALRFMMRALRNVRSIISGIWRATSEKHLPLRDGCVVLWSEGILWMEQLLLVAVFQVLRARRVDVGVALRVIERILFWNVCLTAVFLQKVVDRFEVVHVDLLVLEALPTAVVCMSAATVRLRVLLIRGHMFVCR